LKARLIELGTKGEIMKIGTKKSTELMEPVQKESKLLNKIKHKIIFYVSNNYEKKIMRELIVELY
jgi:hypothetical protein